MEKLRIIVGGLVGQIPLGGLAWDYFHYVLGLHQLGHEVYYHEDTWVWPYDPKVGYPTDDPGYSVSFLREFFEAYAPELVDRWHYVLLHDKHFGMTREAFDEVARTADVFLNLSGACFVPDALSPRAVKVWMDTDPGYNHLRLSERPSWAENIDRWIEQVRGHDKHVTYAENVLEDDCLLPRLDKAWNLKWIPTRPIATLGEWRELRETPPPADAPFTTVMTWDYFAGPLTYKGVEYHGKPPEYERFKGVAARAAAVGIPIALAVGGSKAPREQIVRDGFRLIDAYGVTRTAGQFRDFLQGSAGEWSVAKNVFVHLRTGWFSTRTASYLAAGRPAVVQETGWSRFVPSGSGVYAYSTVDEALAGLERIRGNPQRERVAAYEVAKAYLSPEAVLVPMMEAIMG